MKSIITWTLLLVTLVEVSAQALYSKSFGNSADKPIIFLHGGPGYNSANFEATTAQKLANNGFYVIVYDRRGEGRSVDNKAAFTFLESFDDLNEIYQKFGIQKASLIGHSFGGVVATLYAEKYPERIDNILLVSAPVSLQETFATILQTSKGIYQEKKDSINLKYIDMLENMDSSSIQYSSFCFMHAMQNGFYAPKVPTEEAKPIYGSFKSDTLLIKYASQMTYPAPQGFWKNEHYTTINLTSHLENLLSQDVKIYGLYGKDDGLYSSDQVEYLQRLIGDDHLIYWDNCSHSVFIDQHTPFIEALKMWIK